MTVSWISSSPEILRAHHARDAVEQAGPMPTDVTETVLGEDGAFRGGLLFSPTNSTRRVTWVYFHGGGFVAGSPATHRSVAAWLAQVSNMPVLSGRYGLAPECAYPSQRDDAIAACRVALGRNPVAEDASRIIIAGDSAGACVALWALRGMDAELRARVDGVALLYGAYGLRQSASIQRYGTVENGLDEKTLTAMYSRLYVSEVLGEEPPWPVDFASEVSEPAYVLAAELDAVFDDSLTLFQQLPRHQIQNQFVVVPDRPHGFLKQAGKDTSILTELQRVAKWASNVASSGPGR